MKKQAYFEIGIPCTEPRVMVVTAENLIQLYEAEGRKVLKAHGCPLTFKQLCKQEKKYLPGLRNGQGDSPVYAVFWMFWGFYWVRHYLQKNDAERAVCKMMFALNWASKMQIAPILPMVARGQAHSEGSSRGGIRKKEKDDARHEKWRTDADAIRAKYPSYKAWQIAGMLHARYKANKNLCATQQTIWRNIK